MTVTTALPRRSNLHVVPSLPAPSPLIERAAYVQTESRGLVDRLFDGKLAPLVSHFAETKQLSGEDIAELKRLIAELDDDA